jgi:hypothetical protein
MEFIPVAMAKNLPIDIVFYMIKYVVGICARFINYDNEFQLQNECEDEKKIDEHSQKMAKKYIENFIKQLETQVATPKKLELDEEDEGNKEQENKIITVDEEEPDEILNKAFDEEEYRKMMEDIKKNDQMGPEQTVYTPKRIENRSDDDQSEDVKTAINRSGVKKVYDTTLELANILNVLSAEKVISSSREAKKEGVINLEERIYNQLELKSPDPRFSPSQDYTYYMLKFENHLQNSSRFAKLNGLRLKYNELLRQNGLDHQQLSMINAKREGYENVKRYYKEYKNELETGSLKEA